MPKSCSFRHVRALLSTIVVGLILSGPVTAAPSNEDLYQMILDLKRDQEVLRQEADEARAAASAANRELDETRRELQAAREQLQQKAGSSRSRPLRIPPGESGTTVAVKALALRPSIEKRAYAIVDPVDGPVPPKTGGNIEPGLGSHTRSVDPDTEVGIRATIGYDFGASGTDAALRFSYLNAESHDSVTEPAGGEIVSPITASRTGLEDADRAEATFELEYRALDLEVGQTFGIADKAEVRLFGGVRYASLEPSLEARYFGDQFDATTPGQVRVASEFDGIGPRLGGSLSWTLGRGLTLFGSAAGSLLIGDLDTHYRQFIPTDPPGTDNNREVLDRAKNQVVPVAEWDVGLNWRVDHSHLSFSASAGYEIEQWFGGQGFLQLPSGAATAGGVDSQLLVSQGDVTLHGPYLNLEIRF